jgi:hypothetical protein
MGDFLRKVMPGEPVNWDERLQHRLVDAMRAEQQGRGDEAPVPVTPSIGPATVLIQNTTFSAVGWFGVLALGAPVADAGTDLTEFQQGVVLQGSTPAGTAGELFGVLLQALQPNEIGEAVICGAIQCQVNVNSTGDKYAKTKASDSTQLNSNSTGGCPIIWKQTGTGTQWAVVLVLQIPGMVTSVTCNGDGTISVTTT